MITISPKTIAHAAQVLRQRSQEDPEDRLQRRIRAMSTDALSQWVETSAMGLGAALSQWQRDGEQYALLEAQHINAQMTYVLVELDLRLSGGFGSRPVG